MSATADRGASIYPLVRVPAIVAARDLDGHGGSASLCSAMECADNAGSHRVGHIIQRTVAEACERSIIVGYRTHLSVWFGHDRPTRAEQRLEIFGFHGALLCLAYAAASLME